MKKYKVGVIGATGMVGQRFVTLIAEHPWFELTEVAASARSAGKPYEEAVAGRWLMSSPIPECAKRLSCRYEKVRDTGSGGGLRPPGVPRGLK